MEDLLVYTTTLNVSEAKNWGIAFGTFWNHRLYLGMAIYLEAFFENNNKLERSTCLL